MQAEHRTLPRLLSHIENSAISDLVLKLVAAQDLPEGEGVGDWLVSNGLIPYLFSQLDPSLTTDVHSNAAQLLMDIISISFQQTAEAASAEFLQSGTPARVTRNELIDSMKT